MLPISGVFEIAIRVKDLARAEAFYKDTLGLREGLRDPIRNWLFLLVGDKAGMIVLQEDRSDWPMQHFAFSIANADLERAAQVLSEKGVAISEPVVHDWLSFRSIYFADPDGHSLELCAPITKSRSGDQGPI